MPEYTHTLIPDRVDFVPDPQQVGAFLTSLVSMGAAPLGPEITVVRPPGEVRSFTNPFTQKTETRRKSKSQKLTDLVAGPSALEALDEYGVMVSGKGPPQVPALDFNVKDAYDFLVRCCLRAEVVSTSDWHDDVPVQREVKFFGKPCSSSERLGIFHNPDTLEVIEVPKAGCARFWIEFEYGKALFPRIEDRLELMEPAIVQKAEEHFGIKFIQGCHWCA